MSSRWKMNRMGFINFWLYDEEIFEFEDGKLLLRGQNGSGKSITTQSFIPFILDGDRTPSRLDPFGSSDRKMEYYFLGEEGREESTGYLFLEFKKQETGQYRTIGIGQRARRGASMTFWGFVLTDGKRIGYDLSLYKEVGSTKLPYSKQDLKKLLGPDVPFTDSPGEYKAMVNKYIFGFRRMEQYEQFIRLLVKVRAPKLSKEFKPTKVYEILDESLQTLTDEELRAMVDAMEKMDSIQSNLEHLKAAQKDAQIIHNEYTRYNQFMLGRKAKAYLESNGRAEQLKQQLEAAETELELLIQEETQKQEAEKQAEQKKHLTDAELEGLRETDLDAVAERLEESRNRRGRLEDEKRRWDEQGEAAREHLLETDRKIRTCEDAAEYCRSHVEGNQSELEERQEILQFGLHEQAVQKIRREEIGGTEDISREIREWRQKISGGLKILKEQEELERQYDQAEQEAASCLAQAVRREAELEDLAEKEENARDAWIQRCYELPGTNQELIPDQASLKELEAAIAAYQGIKDHAAVSKKWEQCARAFQKAIQEQQNRNEQEQERIRLEQKEKQEELRRLKAQKDWEPERSENRIRSRQRLTEAGILWIPFYQAVEFAPQVSDSERDLLEEQLKEAGFLDALVVEQHNWSRIRTEFPEYADSLICAPRRESGNRFKKLIPGEGLQEGLRKETEYILSAMSEEEIGLTLKPNGYSGEENAGLMGPGGFSEKETGLILGADGFYKNGLLEGRSLGSEEATLIGQMSRKRRLERQISGLEQELEVLREQEEKAGKEGEHLEERLQVLEQELAQVPDGALLDSILEDTKECRWYLEQEKRELKQAKQEAERLKQQKDNCLQRVIRIGRELPYARTCAAYQEAEEAAAEYLDLWIDICSQLGSLRHQKALIESEEEKKEQYEENLDTAIREASGKKHELEILAVTIQQAEEFLNRPENRMLAKRLEELRAEKQKLEGFIQEIGKRLAVIENQKTQTAEKLEEKRAALEEEISRETSLRSYFEEELNLKLVMDRGTKAWKDCAVEAWSMVRERDRNQEANSLIDSLYQTYHKYSGSLLQYGIAMEDCFSEGAADGQALRKRQRIVSVWKGKKLYFSQFCQALKNSIEETELLIQEKDRELFVDILSRTLSQQLTDRIAESRQWIQSMSALMKQMDTSMGLSFSLEWKAKTAEGQQEIDTLELEKLLRRDQKLLTAEDVERVARHFRSKIHAEKIKVVESGGVVNYMDLVRDALDYRKWFEFQMFYYRNQEGKRPLTNAAFNKFSGGEKAMAMYVPLFAAVNAQYQKSSKEDYPRMIALDEAFAGVDDKNISSMFQLVKTLDFDYIMNSQAIWGCYETVPALRISELYRPLDAKTVTVIHYTWNGHERILDEQ